LTILLTLTQAYNIILKEHLKIIQIVHNLQLVDLHVTTLCNIKHLSHLNCVIVHQLSITIKSGDLPLSTNTLSNKISKFQNEEYILNII